MITINLLPKRFRKATEREKVNFSIVATFILLFIIVGLAVELLYATKNFLGSNLESLQNQRQAYEQYFESQVNTEVYEDVKKTNLLGTRVEKIQDNRTLWSDIITEVASATPGNVTLQSIKGDKIAQTIEVTGVAGTREKLLEYTQTLDKSDNFAAVDLPSSYLSDQTDAAFEITIALTAETITNQ